ncbi:glutathione S-transferase family protein [Nisaea sediminum]|uniref:glutathione S-transferase family protein n=1 Tax=Nisaea sediminum TaxID=2775867 RepID=UPI001867415A|nr:glutathione S-transferase family protein [Nisaea sediminum]
MSRITLVSHTLCPYVQRAAIALAEKGVPFERIYIDLAEKPDWFRALSPLGKVPLLQVRDRERDAVIFESSVILEFLEETQANPLHPADPLDRARHRSWIEFGSSLLNGIARLYNAPDEEKFNAESKALRDGFARLETELETGDGSPFFAGERFSLVDAVFGPIFRYLDVFESRAALHFAEDLPLLAQWRQALSERDSVRNAVGADYPALLGDFLKKRNAYVSGLVG